MKRSDFHYDLPPDRIAQEPVEPRDHSHLLVLDRKSETPQHQHFYDIVDHLHPGDVLILNSTRVFPARLRGKKRTGGKVEILLLGTVPNLKPSASWGQSPISNVELVGDCPQWRGVVRGTTKAATIVFPEGLEARMVQRLAQGEWVLEFSSNHLRDFLNRHGEMPLPPYIKRPAVRAADLVRYQTVYAKQEGAVAAPTAGFHFTPELLEKIHAKGVRVLSVLLHVGWGTFRPIRTDSIEDHQMLPESYEVAATVADELNQARQEGRRIIAVGTTAVRTLETICDEKGTFHSGQGEARLFIYPGYRFRAVDGLITNFHLPDSTPLLLACAFYAKQNAHPNPLPGGEGESQPRVREPFSLRFAYDEAIREGYRFYSYGDAMFIQ